MSNKIKEKLKITGAGNVCGNGTKYKEIRANGKKKDETRTNSTNDKEKQILD